LRASLLESNNAAQVQTRTPLGLLLQIYKQIRRWQLWAVCRHTCGCQLWDCTQGI
jgi:hypothetical protein